MGMRESHRRLLCLSLCIFLPLGIGACSGGKKRRTSGPTYTLDRTRMHIRPGVTIEVEIAETEESRAKAPADQISLCAACGLLLAFGNPQPGRFSTEGMKMDVDVVWLDRLTVVGVASGLRAPIGVQRASTSLSPVPVTELLLLPSGAAAELGIVQGQKFKVDRG